VGAVEAKNLDTARAMYDAWNEGNVDRMIDFWAEDGDWRWEDFPDAPDSSVVVGREAVEAHLREMVSLLGDVRITVEEVVEVEDGVVLASIKGSIRGAQSGVELEDAGVHLVYLEGGRVRRFRTFRGRGAREQALAALRSDD
jgi:ketosteroid isomerase-like protein